ncbi:MAG: hypothetical protein J5729_00400 [Bacteroidaceae bacterium]|nr:hypothetical protein [Bacteroidaceae bacterium]
MNLYVRYYDGEAIVSSVEELIYSLKEFGVPEEKLDDTFIDELYDFINSKNIHPKRFKVSQRQYFILIKTNVDNLDEFKANAKKNEIVKPKKTDKMSLLSEPNPGWYDSTLVFKRVIYSPARNRYVYVDTPFRVKVKAESALDSYNRIIEHLQNRQDIDPRSQYPSAKGNSFSYTFLGEA